MTLINFPYREPTEEEVAWQEDARCREADPEAWFPEPGGGAGREAKRVCASCEVRLQCLQFAIDFEMTHGIWGGLGERERRRLRRAA